MLFLRSLVPISGLLVLRIEGFSIFLSELGPVLELRPDLISAVDGPDLEVISCTLALEVYDQSFENV